MSREASAVFGIDLDGNAKNVSEDTARSLLGMGKSFTDAQARVKQLNESLRGLSGKSAEVAEARTRVQAALSREKTIMNEASVAAIKHGVSLGAVLSKQRAMEGEAKTLAEETKKAEEAARSAAKGNKDLLDVVKGMGGPLANIQGNLSGLREKLSGARAAQVAFAAAATLVWTAIAAVGTALVAGGVALARWILLGADANRSMQLLREGAVRASDNAANLGTQVDALSRKVPTAKSELNAMATDLYRTFNNTTLSGKGIVDVMDLVAQATAAAGGKVANTLENIVERGKLVGRLQINPLELQGTGIKFQDVAGELAKQLHVSIGAAQKALFEGRVKLDDGAHALAAAVNARFGELNARKMLSFDVLVQKFHESLQELTSGVKLEPLGKALRFFFDAFDQSTTSGRALKALVDVIGNGLVKGLTAAVPIVRGLLLGMGIAALQVGIAVLKAGLAIKKTFGLDGKSDLLTFESAVTAGKVAMWSLVAVMGVAAVAATPFVLAMTVSVAGLYGLWKAAQLVADGIFVVKDGLVELAGEAADWGGAIVDGLIAGISSKWAAAKDTVSNLADLVSGTFKDALGIASPSKLFAGFGGDTVDGYVAGVGANAGDAQAAVDGMAPGAPSARSGGFGGSAAASGGRGKVELHVHIDARGAHAGVEKSLTSSSFLAQLTHEIEHLLQASGVLTQTESS